MKVIHTKDGRTLYKDDKGHWLKKGSDVREPDKELQMARQKEIADKLNGTELTDEQMEAEMEAEFKQINKTLDDFLNHNPKNKSLDDFDTDLSHIEKSTIKDLKRSYIDEYNKNVEYYGDGFEFYDPDQSMVVLYKDGSAMHILPGMSDGSKKIPTTGIDTIIIDSGWGSAVAGKHVELVNYREQVDYGKYGYKDIKQRYNDFNDIRTGLSMNPIRWR